MLSKHYLSLPPIRTMLGLAGVLDAPKTELQIAYWAAHLVTDLSASTDSNGAQIDMRLLAFPFLEGLRADVAKVCAFSD